MSNEGFKSRLIQEVGTCISQNPYADIYYIAISPDGCVTCHDNNAFETTFVRNGWDVWRIYRNEDLTTQLNTIVKHYY